MTTATGWQPIATAPTSEREPFLVKTPGNDAASQLVLQVSVFEGNMYPDHMGCNVDFGDRVTTATEWCPVP